MFAFCSEKFFAFLLCSHFTFLQRYNNISSSNIVTLLSHWHGPTEKRILFTGFAGERFNQTIGGDQMVGPLGKVVSRGAGTAPPR